MKLRRVSEPAEAPPPPPWVAPATREQLEENLFRFLVSLRTGRPEVTQPLLAERATLRTLYRKPSPELVEALRRLLDDALVELDQAGGHEIDLDPSIWGFVLALHNCLFPLLALDETDPLFGFHRALLPTLLPARTEAQVLACHALIDGPAAALPALPPSRALALETLIARSPLTAIAHLDVFTPAPLLALVGDLLPGGRDAHRLARSTLSPWHSLDDWLDVLQPLLGKPWVARFLRQRWLDLPETRDSCRNPGLLLEALRRRGGWRDFLLEFYEAYEYFTAVTVEDAYGRPVRYWPILGRIEQLLRAGGTSEAAFRINRWGNAYFLKFRPLVQIVIEEKGVPRDYAHLTADLIRALRPLLDLSTEGVGAEVEFGDVEFGD